MQETKRARREWLIEARKDKGMSQSQLVREMEKRFSYMMTREALSHWETGRYEITNACLYMLAQIFGLTMDEIFEREAKHAAERKRQRDDARVNYPRVSGFGF